MKLNKTFGRIATTLVATAMLASVAAVPAFAVEDGDSSPSETYAGVEDGTQYANGAEITNLTFKKVLQLPENVPVPDVDFNFTLEGTDADETETVRGLWTTGAGGTSIPVHSADGKVSGTASFTGSEETTAVTGKTGVVQAEVTVNIPLAGLADDFTDTGAYKYILSEDELTVNNEYDDYILDEDDRVVYLYVQRADGNPTSEDYDKFIVTGAVMMDPDATYNPATGKSNGVIENTYQLNKEGEVVPNELTVEKKVTGAMSSPNDEFVFNIKIDQTYTGDNINDPNNTGKSYTFVYEKWDEEEGKYIVDLSKPAETVTSTKAHGEFTWQWIAEKEITLKHNERVHIYGLSDGQQIDITESKVAGKGDGGRYQTTTYTVDDGEVKSGEACTVHFTDANVDVSYLNTLNAVSPTGLIMDIAPYALLVVVAAAGCFVFLRKRRED